ncbi:hypothetical protein V6N11_024307 [Hibiscus sabdariffa]|uniref:Uncharacterized protein n=1 Tax=Hibiscus sabdariffa TaxID=183260 RepID=A0ABR2N7T0_9ROSI
MGFLEQTRPSLGESDLPVDLVFDSLELNPTPPHAVAALTDWQEKCWKRIGAGVAVYFIYICKRFGMERGMGGFGKQGWFGQKCCRTPIGVNACNSRYCLLLLLLLDLICLHPSFSI